MGEVYEYFLGNFARAEGKRGGEFFTPPSVVRVIVEVLEPSSGRVYDPCCGSGGMFVQTENFIAERDGNPKSVSIYGQESVEQTWRMAKMNLAIHGIANKGLGARWGDTFVIDQHAGVLMNYVMANPPFNIKDWARDQHDPRWRFGIPPATNANYAWIQHILSKLAPRGQAGVVMANGSMSSNSSGEKEIRERIVEAGLVSCVVALPANLFRSTGIPVCVWFFAMDKRERSGQVLFVDARGLGHLVRRAERVLTGDEVTRIGDAYHAWRGSAFAKDIAYQDVPGFCRSVPLDDIADSGLCAHARSVCGCPGGRGRRRGRRRQGRAADQGFACGAGRIRAGGADGARTAGAAVMNVRLGDHLDFSNGTIPPVRERQTGGFPSTAPTGQSAARLATTPGGR